MTESETHPNVPRQDLMRRVTQLTHIRTALDDARPMYREDEGDSGHNAWDISERNNTIDSAELAPGFETEILLQLDHYAPAVWNKESIAELEKITEPVKKLPGEVSLKSRMISKRAAQVALERCGIFVEHNGIYTVPDDMYAGLAWYRADISSSLDRYQYELLQDKVEPFVSQIGVKQADGTVVNHSIYSFVPYYDPHDLGIDASSKYGAWWTALRKDLTKIDETYPPSESFETAVQNQSLAPEVRP